ncbi:MAG TPA: hypothetical protein VGL63_10020 [Streptosporangiaceae bacterium]|jgi:hypothetical protein
MSGFLLILLGAWGALIPFIGPYFHYAYTPTTGWTYTTGRLWLEILPGAGALLGGLIVLVASMRPMAVFGAWLAAMSGAWFVVGRPLSTLWTAHGAQAAGVAVGSTLTRAVEDVGFFTGLGAAIIFLAAMALGRFTVIGARETALAAEAEAAAERRDAEQQAAGRRDAEQQAAADRRDAEQQTVGRRAWRARRAADSERVTTSPSPAEDTARDPQSQSARPGARTTS